MINIRISHPDKWRDYFKFTFACSSYATDVCGSIEFEYSRELDKIKKSVDRT